MEIDKAIYSYLCNLDNYEEIVKIDGAGQSYAFKAHDNILDREVFIKVYWYTPEYEDSLLSEPRRIFSIFNSNSLSRRHIANIYNAEKVEIENEQFILAVMEYCDNNSISNAIQTNSISMKSAIDYAKDICEGLHFLHSVNLLHRDIKPENIMIHDGCCKLIDFGSTINIKKDEDSARVNSTKTLLYSPFEILSDEKIFYKSSDIYQIGIVLYEMLNGRLQFTQEHLPKRLISAAEKKLGKQINNFEPWEYSDLQNIRLSNLIRRNLMLKSLSPPKPYYPKSIDRLIKSITNSDPRKRPQSCAYLRASLSKITVPDWNQTTEGNYIVSDLKGRDYRIINEILPRKGSHWFLESSLSGQNKYRKNHSIQSLEDAVKYVNSM